MDILRMDLADTGSPEGLVSLILKHEPSLPLPVPIEELALQLEVEEIAELKTEGFEGGLVTDKNRSRGIILVKKGVSAARRRFTIGHELGHFLVANHVPDKDGQFLCSKPTCGRFLRRRETVGRKWRSRQTGSLRCF